MNTLIPLSRMCSAPQPRRETPSPAAGSATAFPDRAGVRVTTADAYLRPGAERTGLTVLTDAVVDRPVIARGRVTGVRLRRAAGPREVGVDEVVLSAGAIGSLLLSGSAPATSCTVSGWTPPSASPVPGATWPTTRCSGWCCSRTRGVGLVG